jgi:hypothetical protein
MPIKEVCSPVNRMKRPAPAPNARPLSSVAPKSASPYARGKPAPASSAPVDLPVSSIKFKQPDAHHPSGGRNAR